MIFPKFLNCLPATTNRPWIHIPLSSLTIRQLNEVFQAQFRNFFGIHSNSVKRHRNIWRRWPPDCAPSLILAHSFEVGISPHFRYLACQKSTWIAPRTPKIGLISRFQLTPQWLPELGLFQPGCLLSTHAYLNQSPGFQ